MYVISHNRHWIVVKKSAIFYSSVLNYDNFKYFILTDKYKFMRLYIAKQIRNVQIAHIPLINQLFS